LAALSVLSLSFLVLMSRLPGRLEGTANADPDPR
jgi:hypothetical protein